MSIFQKKKKKSGISVKTRVESKKQEQNGKALWVWVRKVGCEHFLLCFTWGAYITLIGYTIISLRHDTVFRDPEKHQSLTPSRKL